MATEYKLSYTAQEIDEKLRRVDNLVINPSHAEVGSTIIVKAVDENGKPTEWEAVDY